MPKRVGFVYDLTVSRDNCITAIREMARSKPKLKRAQYMKAHAEEFGETLSEQLSTDTWKPRPYREKTIKDGMRMKERHLKIPCLWDQCVHHAVVQVLAPYIQRRNYFYNCGSIPGAGQIRATRAMRRWMASKKILRYGMSLDIEHFFENCKAEIVMKALSRIFKDKKFLALNRKILASMGDELAIGFTVSHWYGNLVLMYIDFAIKQRIIPGCKYVRYMDDMVLLANNKRQLHKAKEAIEKLLNERDLKLKGNWQIYKIEGRGVTFLSYRFFHGYTIMRKRLMYRISKRAKKMRKYKHLSPHEAASMLSYLGTLKYCDSYNFKKKYWLPYVNIKKCKGVVRNEMRRVRQNAA